MFQITHDSGKLQLDENYFREIAKKSLPGMDADNSGDSKVTISVHSCKTPKSSKRQPAALEENTYILAALGGADQIKIPQKLSFQNPRHLWMSFTWTENNANLRRVIEEDWDCLDKADDVTLAKFLVMRNNKKEPLSHKDGKVRLRNSKKYADLEVWAHNRDSKAIISQLSENTEFKNWWKNLDWKRDILSQEKEVHDQFFCKRHLPISAKHATIHFRLCDLARPNQLGSAQEQPHTTEPEISSLGAYSSGYASASNSAFADD